MKDKLIKFTNEITDISIWLEILNDLGVEKHLTNGKYIYFQCPMCGGVIKLKLYSHKHQHPVWKCCKCNVHEFFGHIYTGLIILLGKNINKEYKLLTHEKAKNIFDNLVKMINNE